MTHEHHHEHHDDHGHDHHGHRPLTYEEAMDGFRADKDEFFRSSPHSPVPEGERAGFTGLPYYPVSTALRFEDLTLEPYEGDQPADFQIPTSDNRLKPAHRAGVLRFELEGEPRALTAYTFDGGDGRSLFVPFLDKTSGTETYGAGRYLDLEPEDDLGHGGGRGRVDDPDRRHGRRRGQQDGARGRRRRRGRR